jgi:hypothetical protein
MGQAQKCGGVKLVNEIPTLSLLDILISNGNTHKQTIKKSV